MLDSLAHLHRRRVVTGSPGRRPIGAADDPTDDPSHGPVPGGFEAVADALVSGGSAEVASAAAGRALASDGVSLGETLSGLRETYAALGGAAPDLAVVEALAVAWSEATLEFLHEVSCEDPLTGLATMPHLRARLAEVYREAEGEVRSTKVTHALVVVDVGGGVGGEAPTDTFTRALRFATVADAVRTVFPGEETIARVGPRRVVALARRGLDLPDRVAVVRTLLADLGLRRARTWVEGLPDDADVAVRVLSELAR